MSRLWVLPVLGLIAVLAACSSDDEALPASVASSTVSATTTVKPKPTSSPLAQTATIAPTEAAAGTLTYTDPTYGYSFDYPASWYLSPPEDNGGIVILYSYDLATDLPEQAGMPVPKDKLKAIFSVTEGVDKPLGEWLEETRSGTGQPPAPTVISSSPITISGKEGLNENVDDGGVKHSAYYLILGGGRVLTISAVPADSQVRPQFEQVLATLKFAS